jgi:hypothetical protein
VAETKYYVSQIRAWINILELDSRKPVVEKVPIASLRLTFPLGRVPEAAFVANVGTNAVNKKIAEVQEAAAKLNTRLRVECWAQFKGAEGPSKLGNKRWPEQPVRIWDGAIVGPGFNSSRGSLGSTLMSQHWISDLDAASVANQNIVKGSMDNLMVATASQTLGGTKVVSLSALASLAVDRSNADYADIDRDIVRPLLLAMLGDKKFLAPSQEVWNQFVLKLPGACSALAAGELPLGNELARKLIAERFDDDRFILRKPLSMFTIANGLATKSIRETVASIICGRIGSSTALEKLLACGQAFQYTLVSNVESATLAPFVPTLNNETVWRTITASEWDHVEGRGYTPRVLAGVGIVGTVGLQTKASQQLNSGELALAGAYQAYPTGQFMFFGRPDWLQPFIPDQRQADSIKEARGLSPDKRATPPTSLGKLAASQYEAQKRLGCRLAHHLWASEVYRNRGATIRGRLRFDICPGSTVALTGVGPSLPQYDTSRVYGAVTSVQIVIDALAPSASTELYVGHLRSDKENERLPRIHPIYQQAWPGSPLVVMRPSDLLPEKTPADLS